MNKQPLLKLENISKLYRQGENSFYVLKDFNLSLMPGEVVALLGPSGSGKSTLLHIAGLLDNADGGKIWIDGVDTATLSDRKKTILRRNKIGFIYQFHHLLPEFHALENVMIPQIIAGKSKEDARAHALEMIDSVGLLDRIKHRPGQLSGGEQQRIAVARALANNPQIILADEPTGNLDPKTGNDVFDLFLNMIERTNATALIATHNHDLAKKATRIVNLSD